MLSKFDPAFEESAEESINLSPLIDIVFILLLFFIVTSVLVEETGVEVEKPESKEAQPLERDSLYFALTADGRVHYGGLEIGIHGIGPTLRRLQVDPSQALIIHADGRVPTQKLLSVLDEIKGAGFDAVSVAALPR